jgi:sucrose-6-phosphate hydrolase SacC (GH32 family)
VLTLSINPGHPTGGSGMQYIVGDFDGTVFTPARWDWLDHGHDYYAGVTFGDWPEPTMIAWLSNWLYAGQTPTRPWRGSTALPRRLALRGDTLVQAPAVDADLPPVFQMAERALSPGRFDLPAAARGAALRIQARIRPGDAPVTLGVRSAGDGSSAVCIRYGDGALTVDRSAAMTDEIAALAGTPAVVRVPLTDGVWDIDVWVDTTSVEIFADGGAITLSEQIFPADDHIGVFIDAGVGGVVVERLTVTDLSDLGDTSR